jgi:drug/metabolite transporter (DMT)-like permease
MNRKNFKTPLSFAGIFMNTVIWGSTFFIAKDILNSINPITLVAYRFSIATAIFAGLVFIKQEKFWVHYFLAWSQFLQLYLLGL